jgi:polysaccharide export outer membrane protein
MSVWGQPELATDALVMTHGVISFPLVGDMAVAGKTVSALTEELREAYLRYYQDPRVSLSVVPVVWPKVYVQGNVKQPGPVDYARERRLLDYVGLAGGFAAGADLANVTVMSSHSDGTSTQRVSLVSADGGPVPNPPLKPGDTIWIGRALPVSVVGAVRSPGSVEYRDGLRLSDYVGMAGGPTNRARLRDAVLKHTDDEGNSAVREVDIAAALRELDDPQLNPVLAPGDVVSVPEYFLAGTLEWSDVLRAVVGVFVWR